MNNISTEKIAIILINWNNWQDTCECMESLFRSTCQDFQIIVLDNGSKDDSVENIIKWADRYKKTIHVNSISVDNIQLNHIAETNLTVHDPGTDIILFISDENLGFSKGCNIGIRYAIFNDIKYSCLLNNDTTIDQECLTIFKNKVLEFDSNTILTPLIYYYDDPKRIWYFGGSLTFTGRRKIYLQDKLDNSKLSIRRVSFVSGCAMFLETRLFKEFGLLTEKFFFGQEDYEFSVRMKANHINIYALPKAKVYHKVGRSNQKLFSDDRLPYVYIGFLNRFVHQKLHSNSLLVWKIWRFINLLYILPKLMIQSRISLNKTVLMARYLIHNSNLLDEVNKDTFYQSKELFKIR